MIESERIAALNGEDARRCAGYVLYWMQAAQRTDCNHALGYASEEADRLGLPLRVIFVIADYPAAAAPQYRWMLAGLRYVAAELRDAGVGFSLRRGDPLVLVGEAARDAALLVVDRSPSRWAVSNKAAIAARVGVRVVEIDGESIVPEAAASPKREWSARTFRLKVAGAVASYASRPLPPVPTPRVPVGRERGDGDEDRLFSSFDASPPPAHPGDRSPEQRFSLVPGTGAAVSRLARFVGAALDAYGDDRNDPMQDGTSGLSPYLHFGQISPLAVIAAARRHGGPGYPPFAEQLAVRRELCRNFVRYSPTGYDAWESLPAWSRATLESRRGDRRAFVYSPGQFEAAATHDPYWNAAQEQLVCTGAIHNYMRMYWGKMILAWSAAPEEGFSTAIRLNDRYALDGRDPNGWAGVAWCFGLHDRPWPSRPVFGTVRAMAVSGLKKKFDADAYARAWAPAEAKRRLGQP
jgi:deoxyribodipyrimidine photo-lyase